MPRVLVLGQTPPPHYGQALMIEKLVTADHPRLRLFHVRMGFSTSMSTVGRARFGKILHLLQIIARVLRLRFRHHVQVLYYVPSGPKLVPVLRDVLLLSLLRPFFPCIIYHFHAAGVSEFLQSAPAPLRLVARAAYGRPDAAIQTSARNPPDGQNFGARRTAFIPNGLEDASGQEAPTTHTSDGTVHLLFVGIVTESKGIMVLLEAARLLANVRDDFRVTVVGPFASAAFEREARAYCREQDLDGRVSFAGELLGAAKWDAYRSADILCFPTFFESESFGNVAVEAMMFGLPVVATHWRGVAEVVDDGSTGLLIPIRDAAALATALHSLLNDPTLRHTLGRNGRQKYLAEYTMEKHLERMEELIFDVATAEPAH